MQTGVPLQGLTKDEQGKRVAHAPTLFYLAHCESVLCNNLLWANALSLSNVAVLGNSLQAYYDHWSVDHAALKKDRCDAAFLMERAHDLQCESLHCEQLDKHDNCACGYAALTCSLEVSH